MTAASILLGKVLPNNPNDPDFITLKASSNPDG